MSDIILDVNAGRGGEAAQPLDDTPFRIALLGDFSGRGSRGVRESGAALASRPAWRVDRDDLDQVMREIGPTLKLQLEQGGPGLVIRFASLDDFHPDRLYERLPVFQALRDLRQRLSNPATFKAAAAELRGETPPPATTRPPSGASVLGDILDEASPPGVEEALAEAGGDLHAFIQRALKPHLVPNPDPRQAELVANVEAAASATLRTILHAPEFQALESLWRATDLLVRQVETGSELKVMLIDLSEPEFRSALPPGADPAESPVLRLLAGHADPVPWSLLVGAYTFGAAADDVDRLAQLAAVGLLLSAPWISAAHPALAGIGPDPGEVSGWGAPGEGWRLFRGTSLARWLGLVLPRFLARLPYGRGLEECERIAFEELSPGASAESFLWGNPAIMVAVILGRSFAEHGWALMRGLEPEVSGLPVGVLGRGPSAQAVGPGEAPLSVRAADALMERGFMPLAPLKESDRVRLVRLQSTAHPVASLLGRWEA
jgi:type VI secretion system protein ImpC